MVWLSLGSLLLGLLLLAVASRVGAAPAGSPRASLGAVVTPFPRRSRAAGAGATPFICRRCGAFLISVDGTGRAERTVRCTLCDQIAELDPPSGRRLEQANEPERAASCTRSFGTLPVR